MPLSNEATIRGPRALCQLVTGRSGMSPMERCNRSLARYKPDLDYNVVLKYKVLGGNRLTGLKTLIVEAICTSTGVTLSSTTLNFPLSPYAVANAICQADATAESRLHLRYGQQAHGSATAAAGSAR